MRDNEETRREHGEEDDRPITRLHIPYDMIIDPDRPQKIEKPPLPPFVVVKRCCTVASWILLFSAVLLILQARPLGFNIFMYMQGMLNNPVWNTFFIVLGRCMLIPALLIGLLESVYLYLRLKRVFFSLLIPQALAILVFIWTLFL